MGWNKTDTGKGWIRHGGIITDFSQPSATVYYGRPDSAGHTNMFVYGFNITLASKVDMGKGWVTTTGFEPDTNEPPRQIWYTRPDNIRNPTNWTYTCDFRVGGWYNIGKGWLRARSPASIIPDLTQPSAVVYYGLPGEVGSSDKFVWSYSINGYQISWNARRNRSSNGWDITENGKDMNYYYRVRTKKNKDGNIIASMYGKIYGPIEFFTRKDKSDGVVKHPLQFTYYLNPTPNDRNVEFDPKRNLLKAEHSWQEVCAP